jgi:hypothetical protein
MYHAQGFNRELHTPIYYLLYVEGVPVPGKYLDPAVVPWYQASGTRGRISRLSSTWYVHTRILPCTKSMIPIKYLKPGNWYQVPCIHYNMLRVQMKCVKPRIKHMTNIFR